MTATASGPWGGSALQADPANYIGQPSIDLSVCPTLVEAGHASAEF